MKISNRALSIFILLLSSFSIINAQTTVDAAPSPFTDVDQSNEYYDAIVYASNNGIFEGYSDGSFRPDSNINRAEFVKIIIKTFNHHDELQTTEVYSDEIDFTDVEEGSWYIPFLRQAVSDGIITGYEDGEFRPSNSINFAEASKIISICANENEFLAGDDVWYQPYISYLAEFDAIPDSIASYDQLITRAETAQVIYDLSQNGAISLDSTDNPQIDPSADAESIIAEGINKLSEVSSFKYNISFIADDYASNSSESAKINLDGSLDATDQNNLSFLINFDISSEKNGLNEFEINGKSLLEDYSIYFYLNENSLIDENDRDDYFNKWLRYSFYDVFNQNVEPDEKIIPLIDINNFDVLENIKYLGQNLVMGEESYHYSVEINKDEFESYISTIIFNSGGTISADELDEMTEMFNPENTRIDFWVGASSQILNKAKLVIDVKADTESIGKVEAFIAFSDFNKPIENVIPEAEDAEIDEVYYLLFGQDIFGEITD